MCQGDLTSQEEKGQAIGRDLREWRRPSWQKGGVSQLWREGRVEDNVFKHVGVALDV